MQPEPLHILMLPSWYPTERQPVFGNFSERHIRAISLTHRVTVVNFVLTDKHQPRENMTAGTDRGVQVVTVTHMPLGPAGRIRALRAALKFIGLHPSDFDLVHCHVCLPAGVPALWLRLRHGLPLVLTEHWTIFQDERFALMPFYKRMLIRTLLSKAVAICPVTRQLGQKMLMLSSAPLLRPIPNVVNTARFFPPPRTATHPGFKWLHVSSLVDDQKNITGLLRGFAKAADDVPESTLTIAGDGSTEYVAEHIQALGLAGRVHLLGEQSEAEVADLMRASDAFVLFSRYENLPCVILEAWCCGLPVVSTDVGGISEYLTPERGVLVPSEDEFALTQAMIRIMTGEVQFDRTAIARFGASHFSPEHIGLLYGMVYKEALD